MLYDPLTDYDEVGQTLIKAARYMDEHGHAKCLEADNKSVCVLGALSAIIYNEVHYCIYADDNPLSVKCCEALQDKVESFYESIHGNIGYRIITEWNDLQSTKETALKLLYDVAEEHKLVKA